MICSQTLPSLFWLKILPDFEKLKKQRPSRTTESPYRKDSMNNSITLYELLRKMLQGGTVLCFKQAGK